MQTIKQLVVVGCLLVVVLVLAQGNHRPDEIKWEKLDWEESYFNRVVCN